MEPVAGRYYDGRRAEARDVVVSARPGHELRIAAVDGADEWRVPWRAIELEPALGRLPRRLRLADGAMVEIAAADLPQAWLRSLRGSRHLALVHWLESAWFGWSAAIVGVVVLGVLLVWVGLPWTADRVARQLPPEVSQRLSSEALILLDRRMFEPSQLPQERKSALRAGFAELVERVDDPTPYRLLFRHSRVGPNAFALPGGEIIMTDQLVELLGGDPDASVAGDAALYLVMAHELGHIHHAHGMRLLLQRAGLAVVAAILFGDISSAIGLAAALPTLLDSGYTRAFEFEADAYAARVGVAGGLGVEPMVAALSRLEAVSGQQPLPWLSTHPASAARIEALRRAAADAEAR